jgi:putative phosphoesterase
VVIGILSDTHGHLYPAVVQALEGADHIIHAGDVGSPRVLAALAVIAPVTAVRGNCDVDAWAESLPLHAELEMAGVRIVVGHIGGCLDDAGADVAISGHTHLAAMQDRGGVLHLNPGSAGPRRFQRPRTVARLTVLAPAGDTLEPASTSKGAGARARVAAEIVIMPDE